MFSEQQQAAFVAACNAMRKAGGALSHSQLEIEAYAVLYRTARDWSSVKRKSVAKLVATSVYRNFDVNKLRQPKERRAEKNRRKNDILKYYRSFDHKSKPSIRRMSREFNASPSAIHQILKDEGLTPTSRAFEGVISRPALEIVRLIESELPSRSYRLADSRQLIDAVGLNEIDMAVIIQEISRGRIPVSIFDTHISTGKITGGTWIVLQKGKVRSNEYLNNWATRVTKQLESPGRARADQRLILSLSDMPLPRNPVLKDVGAVRLICDGSQSLRSWRSFLRATLGSDPHPSHLSALPIVNDIDAIVNALNGAIRLNKLDELLPDIPYWLKDESDKAAALFALKLAIELRTAHFNRPMDAVNYWINATYYFERVSAGLVPGRDVSDVDMLSTYNEVDNAKDLYDLFVACGELPVTPCYLNPKAQMDQITEEYSPQPTSYEVWFCEEEEDDTGQLDYDPDYPDDDF